MKLSEEQIAFYDVAKNFAIEKMEPYAEKWDEEKTLPVDTLKELAQLGFAGIYVSPDLGGSGLSRLDSTLIFEGLSQGCTSTAAFLSIHNMATWMIDSFGNQELRERYVPDLCTMQKISSYCLTEPGAGSDAGGLRTRQKSQVIIIFLMEQNLLYLGVVSQISMLRWLKLGKILFQLLLLKKEQKVCHLVGKKRRWDGTLNQLHK